MRAATKALMIANARGGNQGGNQGGNRGGRSEMEMGGGEMRGGYQGWQNEARGGYEGMRGNYPCEAYGRYEGGQTQNGGYGEMRGGYGRSEMEYGRSEMRRGGGQSEMRNEGGQSEMRGEGNMRQEMRGGQNRIGYEGGGSARSEMEDMEARRRYRRDSRGRFRSELGEEMEQDPGMHYPMPYPFPPPVYEEESRNPIGFSAEGGGAELHMIRGGADGTERPFDKQTAEDWMKGLENEDGTKGAHWSLEQVKQLMAQKGWQEDPIRAWVAINIMYSDYCGVAKKANANNIDFYVSMAKAFLGDKDAGAKDKLSAYYRYIVK